jgi:hypothetical protein
MTVKALFETWTALKDILTDPNLSEDHSDALVNQSMQLIVAMTDTPSNGMTDVLLKLETYGREVEAGPCDECDALLGSALQDRAIIFEQRYRSGQEGRGLAVIDRGEHRPRPPQERYSQNDPGSPYTPRRDQDSRSTHP